MENKEKVLFVYPTLLREGQSSKKPYKPDSLLIDISPSKKNTIIVTASILLLVLKNTFITVDVYLDNEAITLDSDSLDGFQEVMDTTYVGDESVIVTTAMHVSNVIFPCSGIYEIRTSLMVKNEEGVKTQVDSISCFLSVFVAGGK
ncbi:hypothetical protein GXP72_12645 [Enterobacter sp. SES19]|uniref:hypothetical protein n=1 Tax=Enterobacter TaxID=547 RepID=UPI0003BF0531|nr:MULTISPECIES: hypothetical protein [Enterobacter]ESN54799.1 hypothetical protein L362_01714 [Enterobacter sp. MGH 16]QIR23233.1 hypothetical protein GXP72_12645 [Enterobacter sp. SES19]